MNADGKLYETRACGRFRKENKIPRVGDKVVISDAGDLVTEILPRKNELERPPVANIDLIVVVSSLVSPSVDTVMLDAFLLTAEAAGIDALLCINKCDMASGAECAAICEIYEKAGYKTVITSATAQMGIDALLPHLKDRVTAFAGNSGVGKSSLLNLIGDSVVLETGAVSEKLARGRHTTRHVELLPLRGGGFVLDTPGFSRVQIPAVEPEELAGLYREMKPLHEKCRFSGCAHLKEPDCAVKTAVENGTIAPQRYENYCFFYEKLSENRSFGKAKKIFL